MPTSAVLVGAVSGTGDHHAYNDDLLMTSEFRGLAEREFPRVFHLLDRPELRGAFVPQDNLAIAAKRRSQSAGFWALLCGLAALMIASGELASHDLSEKIREGLAALGVMLALTSVLIAGFGMLRGKQKDEWLHRRLFTERLRQFHFQTFVWRLPEIVASWSNRAAYEAAWQRWFAAFNYAHAEAKSSELFPAILGPGVPPVWLHGEGRRPVVPPKSEELTELFRAYRALRLNVQNGYAMHVLRTANGPRSPGAPGPSVWKRLAFPFLGWPLRRQRALLHGIWLIGFAGLVVMHLVALVATFKGFHWPWLPLGVMWCALIAIAAKTLGEGLGLEREIERYEEYRAVVADVIARFDPSGDPHDCVELMLEFERATFEEMRAFLRAHEASSFVL